MTRMYLSPTATFFAKIGLIIIELLIGLYNLISYPIRIIKIKTYIFFVAIATIFYAAGNSFGLELSLAALIITIGIFTLTIIACKTIYKFLKKKVSPKIAFLINSPLGIPLNKFYNIA